MFLNSFSSNRSSYSLYPQITDITPTSGFSTGGTLLTLSGHGTLLPTDTLVCVFGGLDATVGGVVGTSQTVGTEGVTSAGSLVGGNVVDGAVEGPLVTCMSPPGVVGVAVTVGLMVNGLPAEIHGLGALNTTTSTTTTTTTTTNNNNNSSSNANGVMMFTYVPSPSVTSVYPMYGYINSNISNSSGSVSTPTSTPTPSGQGLGQGSLITVQGKDFPPIPHLLTVTPGNYTSSLSMLLCVFGGPVIEAGAEAGSGTGLEVVQYPKVYVRALSVSPTKVTCQVPPLATSTPTSNTTSTMTVSSTVPFAVVADYHESLPLYTGNHSRN